MAVQIIGGEMILAGMVGDDYWGDGFTSSQVVAALAQLGRGTDIVVRLNSGGGIATEGAAIHAALSSHKGQVTIIVEGIAASAASLIACAGDVVEMALGSVLMIHDPATITWGTVAEHELAIRMLESLATSYAETYAEKTGATVEATRALMRAETWLTPAEAVAQKFADRLSSANENDQPAEPTAFAYAMYANAPEQIVALASAKGWKTPQSAKPAAVKASAPAPASAGAPPATVVASTPPAAPSASTESELEPPMAELNEGEIRKTATADANTRIQTILTSDEAKGREAMAQHLAFKTEQSADDAIALLKVSPMGGEPGETVDPTAEFVTRKTTAQNEGLGGPSGKPGAVDVKSAWAKTIDKVNARVGGPKRR